MDKVKIGLYGVGHLGKIHLKCLGDTPFEVVGFYDPDRDVAEQVSTTSGVKYYDDVDTLLSVVDAVDIVSPTVTHHDICLRAIKAEKHVFVEKPITSSVPEAQEIMSTLKGRNLVFQVGHVERYNPAFKAINPAMIDPQFIEVHRLATFNPRGTDVSVILDLMIHDLDLILALVKGEVIDIQAKGVAIVSDLPDICNVRLSFSNGCVANVTASRISMKAMRKFRLFQKDAYTSIDFLAKETQTLRMSDVEHDGLYVDTSSGRRYIDIELPEILNSNAIADELNDFYTSIVSDKAPLVGVKEGHAALDLAYKIEEKVGLSI